MIACCTGKPGVDGVDLTAVKNSRHVDTLRASCLPAVRSSICLTPVISGFSPLWRRRVLHIAEPKHRASVLSHDADAAAASPPAHRPSVCQSVHLLPGAADTPVDVSDGQVCRQDMTAPRHHGDSESDDHRTAMPTIPNSSHFWMNWLLIE